MKHCAGIDYMEVEEKLQQGITNSKLCGSALTNSPKMSQRVAVRLLVQVKACVTCQL